MISGRGVIVLQLFDDVAIVSNFDRILNAKLVIKVDQKDAFPLYFVENLVTLMTFFCYCCLLFFR